MFKLTEKFVEKLKRRLRRKNREFARLTPAKQRIRIARDRTTRQTSDFGAVDLFAFPNTEVEERLRDVQEDSPKLDLGVVLAQERCQVCGIGSLFVAAVQRHDQLTLEDSAVVWDGNSPRFTQVQYLSRWFKKSQLDLVEAYFEAHEHGRPRADQDSPIWKTAHKGKVWNGRQVDRNRALRMIMENIISNGGRFDPTRGAHRIPKEPQSSTRNRVLSDR